MLTVNIENLEVFLSGYDWCYNKDVEIENEQMKAAKQMDILDLVKNNPHSYHNFKRIQYRQHSSQNEDNEEIMEILR